MTGPASGEFEERGLCLRAAGYLFEKLGVLGRDMTSVQISALEIYNDTLYDLLRDPTKSDSPKLFLADTPQGVIIPSLHLLPVSSVDEALTYLMEANLNRQEEIFK